MQEEFHGNGLNGSAFIGKQLYGWGTINANVWLPSLSELVGYDPNHYNAANGCYYSAMQGLNISTWTSVDAKGGTQWAYFQPYNVSGGREAITAVCNQQACWLRSPDYAQIQHVTCTIEDGNVKTYILPTNSLAVHPAVSSEQVPYRSESLFNQTAKYKERGKKRKTSCLSLSLFPNTLL